MTSKTQRATLNQNFFLTNAHKIYQLIKSNYLIYSSMDFVNDQAIFLNAHRTYFYYLTPFKKSFKLHKVKLRTYREIPVSLSRLWYLFYEAFEELKIY